MQSYWALVVLAGVVVAAPTVPSSASYEQVVASAVNLYNEQQNPEYAFRLLEAEPQPDWQTSGETTQPLKFSIKETICHFSGKTDLSQCDFKDDGLDRDCSGFYSTRQMIVQCEDIDEEMSRIVRSRWKRFWRKTKRFVKKHGVSIALTAARFG